MVILSEIKVVSFSLIVSSAGGSERVSVEIKNDYIHIRARSMQTDVSMKQAALNPSYIANGLKALVPDVWASELDQLVNAVIKYLE